MKIVEIFFKMRITYKVMDLYSSIQKDDLSIRDGTEEDLARVLSEFVFSIGLPT